MPDVPSTAALLYFTVMGLGVVTSIAWLASLLRGSHNLNSLPMLRADSMPDPTTWPALSVVIPACNEVETLAAAITTLRAQDYPDLQIVIVDDRSTDGTSELVDQLAAADPRVTAVHVRTLPSGWLGKVHALRAGIEQARGAFVLFADADIHYAEGALRAAMALVEKQQLDHLALVPKMNSGSFVHEVVVDAFGAIFMRTIQIEKINDPDSDAYVGTGAFNLFRRETYDRSERLDWLRLEVADDVGLGLLLKRAGARTGVWLGPNLISVLWYPSLAEMAKGLEKNMFPVVGHYRLWRVLLRVTGMLIWTLGPFVGALGSHLGALCLVAAMTGFVPLAVTLHRRLGQRIVPVFFVPLGFLVFAYLILRSTFVCLRNGAIEWRGTRYALDELRVMQRVKV